MMLLVIGLLSGIVEAQIDDGPAAVEDCESDNVVSLLQADLAGPFSVSLASHTTKPRFSHTHAHREQKMRFMPEEQVLFCACAKCGTTSLAFFVYEEAFNKTWPYTDPPYVQVPSYRWQGRLTYGSPLHFEDPQVFKYALYRDPKERLISAWKSKLACDHDLFGTDLWERRHFVQQLIMLAGTGQNESASCFTFLEYVQLLEIIHANGNESKLNGHFIPQHLDCFKDYPVQMWSQVAQISDHDAAWRLAERFGDASKPSFPHTHASTAVLQISEDVDARMIDLTKEEYLALRLTLPSSAKAYSI